MKKFQDIVGRFFFQKSACLVQYFWCEFNPPSLYICCTLYFWSANKRRYEQIIRFILGQRNLKKTSVLVVGAGGLGCPCCIYLCAAGVGRIGVVDFDDIELSNLHRQILHTEKLEGTSKAHSIKKACKELINILLYFLFFNVISVNCFVSLFKNQLVCWCNGLQDKFNQQQRFNDNSAVISFYSARCASTNCNYGGHYRCWVDMT